MTRHIVQLWTEIYKMNPVSPSFCSFSQWKRDSNCFDDEPNCKKPRRNDLFMNYSFEDVGKSFISHLQGALRRNGFAISDHTILPTGQDVRSELLKAIEESEIYLPVFSINYASSERSLDELVHIMDNFDRRKVLPIFYKVKPSDVRSQGGSFNEAFQAHQTNFDCKKVKKWKQALKNAGQLSGLELQNGDEAKFISKIVKQLKKMQSPQELYVADHPVGIESRVEELILKLRLDSKDVLVVAVLGISGIGKTTIVKATYNRIAAEFDAPCFLADIPDHCRKRDWKVKLQKKLISYLTQNDKVAYVRNHDDGVTNIRKLIRHLKVLLVLDNVDSFKQLEALGMDHPECFGDGSRIIVTTRDKQSLGYLKDVSYHTIMLLNKTESLNLFTWFLFARDDYVNTKFIEEVVGHAGGLPLVLKVWSCLFTHTAKEKWPNILKKLQRIPHDDVQKQLQISYDPLSVRSKKLFLDIACFFVGMEEEEVVKVLYDEDSAFFPDIEIQYLIDKCLVVIDDYRLKMNHAVREMGREIVRQENEDEPGKRSRLSNYKDFVRVLTECSGTELVECIRPDYVGEELIVKVEALRKMTNLRLINFGYQPHLTWSADDDMQPMSFKKLKYLAWHWSPFKSLDNIDMANVVVIRLWYSKLEIIWEGFKSLKKLRILDVMDSYSLIKTGNFDGLENLEELCLRGCENLEELDSSIGYLHKLTLLDLHDCSKLGSEDPDCLIKIAGLRNLQILKMANCNVLRVPSEIENLVSLEQLIISRNTFSSLPDSFGNLPQLVHLEIDGCSQLRLLPLLPSSLRKIVADQCPSLDVMPFDSTEGTYIFRTKAFKESPAFTTPLFIRLSGLEEEVPDWYCSYWTREDDVLSFVAPTHLDKKIRGIILCAIGPLKDRGFSVLTLEMHNETKKTSHRLDHMDFRVGYSRSVMFYPLDDTTLVVEAGDTITVVFQFVDGHGDTETRFFGGGYSWIYEGDVVDSKLLLHPK